MQKLSVGEKTQPYLEKRGRFWENAATWILFAAAGYSVLDKALCAHWKHCSEGAFDLSTADLPAPAAAPAAPASAISTPSEAATPAASFASAFSRRSAHAVVRVKGLRLDDIGERVISYCSLCGDGALSRADCAAAVTGGVS